MKFLFADCLDFIDPDYDFENDEYHKGRKPYWDDQFPHEYLGYAPYDGILVSRAVVGDHKLAGTYSQSQSMRFRRVGARKFLRLDNPQYLAMPIFGDCGAFQYSTFSEPPYTPKDMIEFYEDGGFSHGLSIDHIIFEFDKKAKGMEGGTADSRHRFQMTLELADEFLKECLACRVKFHPIGVVQGWSPGSMYESTRRLVAMGYDYIAIGGLVPLTSPDIHVALSAVIDAIKYKNVKIHLLGFAKADSLSEFTNYPITSFDTTSPLIKAFKDDTKNYYELKNDQHIEYYTAIRIPQAYENNTLARKVKAGLYSQEYLRTLEIETLKKLRDYDKGKVSINEVLESVMEYSRPLMWSDKASQISNENKLAKYLKAYQKTLTEKPWKRCNCKICKSISVESIIFRASNRNKRRGIHNLIVFYEHLKTILRNKQWQS